MKKDYPAFQPEDFSYKPILSELHRYISEEERAQRFAQGLESWPREMCEKYPAFPSAALYVKSPFKPNAILQFTFDGQTAEAIFLPLPKPNPDAHLGSTEA